MSEIEFNYKGKTLIIHVEKKENLKEAIKKFLIKSGESIDNNFLFLYGGNKIEEGQTFDQQANDIDKSRNRMSIIVIDTLEGENIIKKKNLKILYALNVMKI